MAAAETAKLLASLELQDKFSKTADAAIKKTGSLEKSFANIGRTATHGLQTAAGNIAKVGAIAAVAAAGLVAGAIKQGISSLEELSRITAQTNAVIGSTGGKAGVTAAKVRELAESLENVTTADDKTIQSGENMLLTFTNIGADVFPQATKAMVNMAIAMNNGSVEGLDLSSTAIQLGKALQDPVKGVTALRKVGVALTDDQTKQIKALVQTGDRVAAIGQLHINLTDAQKKALAAGKTFAQAGVRLTKDQQKRVDALAKEIGLQEAQKIILGELETEFGKAGEAAGKDFGSATRRLKDAWEDLTVILARGALPVITRVADLLRTKISDPKFLANVEAFGKQIAGAFDKAIDFADKVPWDAIASGLRSAADWAGKLFEVFRTLPPEVQATIVSLAGLNKLSGGAITGIVGELGKGLIKGVLGMNAAVVNINAAKVNGGGAPGSPAGGLPGVLTAVLPAAAFAGLQLSLNDSITGIFKTLIGDSLPEALRPAGNAFEDIPKLVTAIQKLVSGQNPTQPTPLVPGLARTSTEQGFEKTIFGKLSTEVTGAVGDVGGKVQQAKIAADIAALQRRNDEIILRALTQQGFNNVVAAVKNQPPPVVNVTVTNSVSSTVTATSVNDAQWTSDRYSSTKTVVRAL